jgi:hypothetical protein
MSWLFFTSVRSIPGDAASRSLNARCVIIDRIAGCESWVVDNVLRWLRFVQPFKLPANHGAMFLNDIY